MKAILLTLVLVFSGNANAFMFCFWAAQNNDVPWSWAESGSDAVITIHSELVEPGRSPQISKFLIKRNSDTTVKIIEAFPNRTGVPEQYTWTDTSYTPGDVYTVVPVSRIDHVHYQDCQ